MKSDERPVLQRNVQLDFFRGLALLVIFINHMPGNPWFHFTPSRLGPSDAAETFVFLSGFAAAIAYGRSFRNAGLAIGSVRVLFRCAQIYAAHIALFILMVTLLLSMRHLNLIGENWQLDNLQYFFDDTPNAVLALTSLRYVPNFIDILPMYFVILLWLPIVWGLSTFHTALPLAFSLALYLSAGYHGWELIADPVSHRTWYFNPFCWQLVFFTGFALSSGWLPVPSANRRLIILCSIYVVFCFPLENPLGYVNLPWFAQLRENWASLLSKSQLGFLRYLHFLAMTYLVNSFMQRHQHWLHSGIAARIVVLGQQSLPMFMFGTCLAFVGGMLLDNIEVNLLNSAWINVAGLGIMVLVAQALQWLEQKPWKKLPEQASAPIRPIHYWPAQALLASALLLITLSPLMVIQQSSEPDLTMAELPLEDKVILPPDEQALDTEEVAYQSSEQPIILPDSL